jgi:hypothetical protein
MNTHNISVTCFPHELLLAAYARHPQLTPTGDVAGVTRHKVMCVDLSTAHRRIIIFRQ